MRDRCVTDFWTPDLFPKLLTFFAMPVLKANHRVVKAAQPLNGKRTRYRIEGVEGLWLDVGKTGKRNWYVRYQPGGRGARTERWYRIGNAASVSLADASERARRVLTSAYADQTDPYANRKLKQGEVLTLGDLYREWYTRHCEPNLARAPTDEITWNTHLEHGLGKQRIKVIRRADIGLVRDRVAADSGPGASNTVLGLINRILNWAVDEGLIEFNPAARLRKVGKSRPRERVLAETDIPKLWTALEMMEGRTQKGKCLSPLTLRSRVALTAPRLGIWNPLCG